MLINGSGAKSLQCIRIQQHQLFKVQELKTGTPRCVRQGEILMQMSRGRRGVYRRSASLGRRVTECGKGAESEVNTCPGLITRRQQVGCRGRGKTLPSAQKISACRSSLKPQRSVGMVAWAGKRQNGSGAESQGFQRASPGDSCQGEKGPSSGLRSNSSEPEVRRKSESERG